MQAFAFEAVLDRHHELGYFADVVAYLEETDEVGEDGESVYERVNDESAVLKKCYTIGKKHEAHLIQPGGGSLYLEPGDQLELMATTRKGHPTVFSIIKPTIPNTSPLHRQTIPFQRVSQVNFRMLK